MNRKHIPMPDGKPNPMTKMFPGKNNERPITESDYKKMKNGIQSGDSVYADFTGADGNEYQFADFLKFPHTPNDKIIKYNNMTEMQRGGKKRRSTRRRKVRKNKTKRYRRRV